MIVQTPAPVRCTFRPEIVHWPEAAKPTDKPDADEACTAKSASPKVLLERALKSIVWLALAIVKFLLSLLPLWFASPSYVADAV